MTDELKNKMEELAYSYEGPIHRNCYGCCQNDSDYEKAFVSGFQAAHDLMKKDYDAKVQKLIRQNRDLINWLNRMSELRWKDSSHAPNFKYCVQELNKTLAEFEK